MKEKVSKKDKSQQFVTGCFSNFTSMVPEKIEKEIFQEIVRTENITIERIISQGQSSPETGWYDQEKSEWVMVLEGEALVEFDDGEEARLGKNDFLMIFPHQKHRVKWTCPDRKTVWLAIYF